MPVRKITNRGSKKLTGFFPSEKSNRFIAWESPVERDYMYLLEFDRSVLLYEEQPFTISYKHNGRGGYRYTPDLKVHRKGKIQIIEVKPKKKLLELLEDEKFKRKIIVAQSFCEGNGWEFKIVTDEDIRTGFLLSNIKLLFKFSRIYVPNLEYLKIHNELLTSGALPIEELCMRLAVSSVEQKIIKTFVFALLYTQRVVFNLQEKLDSSTVIQLP